jgi:hypothetical protein
MYNSKFVVYDTELITLTIIQYECRNIHYDMCNSMFIACHTKVITYIDLG